MQTKAVPDDGRQSALLCFVYLFFSKAKGSHYKEAEELHVAAEPQVADPWCTSYIYYYYYHFLFSCNIVFIMRKGH